MNISGPDLTLAQEFLAFSPLRRRNVHIFLCEYALEIWRVYISSHSEIDYVESITGTHQVVDQQLPFDAYEAARKGVETDEIARRYQEPITAMQDGDLEFPDYITFAYYAIYNLYLKYALGKKIDDWLIVNQALAAEKNDQIQYQLLSVVIKSTRLEIHDHQRSQNQHWQRQGGMNQ